MYVRKDGITVETSTADLGHWVDKGYEEIVPESAKSIEEPEEIEHADEAVDPAEVPAEEIKELEEPIEAEKKKK